MMIYLPSNSPQAAEEKLIGQSVFTKMLYFNFCMTFNLGIHPIDYNELKRVIKPSEDEEIKLGESIKILVDAGLIEFHVGEVGHA